MEFTKRDIKDFLKFANEIDSVNCDRKNGTVTINADDWVTLKRNAKSLFDSSSTDETNERIIPFGKLIENGVGVGSIIKTPNSLDYYLITDGFPKEFNIALCCEKLGNGYFHLYKFAFHWSISRETLDSFVFKLITEDEKRRFIDGCVDVILNAENYHEHDVWGWYKKYNIARSSYVLDSLYRYGLIDKVRYFGINDLIKRTYNVDLVKYFDKRSYCRRAALYELINEKEDLKKTKTIKSKFFTTIVRHFLNIKKVILRCLKNMELYL